MLPQITMTGNLVSDPELRFTPSGKAVARMRVASNNRVKDRDGTWRDGETCFLDVSVWEAKAEALVEAAGKGATVMVTGRLGQRTFDTKEGEKRTVYEVTADEVGVVVRAKARTGAADPWAATPASNVEDEPPF